MYNNYLFGTASYSGLQIFSKITRIALVFLLFITPFVPALAEAPADEAATTSAAMEAPGGIDPADVIGDSEGSTTTPTPAEETTALPSTLAGDGGSAVVPTDLTADAPLSQVTQETTPAVKESYEDIVLAQPTEVTPTNEVVGMRTYDSRTFDEGNGVYRIEQHAGHIFYKDEQGDIRPSDVRYQDKGNHWSMTKHNYKLNVAKNFGDPKLIRYDNKYEGANHSITYEPQSIVWYNSATGDVQVFRSQQNVTGTLVGDNVIRYTDAFGAGIDFEVTLLRSGFKKEVVINNKPASLPTPPTPNYKMVVLFKYTGNGLDVEKRTGEKWNKTSDFNALDGFSLGETANPAARSFILPAYAVDSASPVPNRVNLNVSWLTRGGALWQAKEIPLNKLDQATYPVRFDTVTSYYSGAGDGWTRGSTGAQSWSTRYSGSGNYANYTDAVAYSGVFRGNVSNQYYQIARGIVQFDTSALDDDAVISSVTVHLYGNKYTGNSPTFDSNFNLSTVTPASNTTLTQSDFNIANHASTILSTSIPYASWSTSTYNEFPLNAAGLAAINKTGYTAFSLRALIDIENNPPADPGGPNDSHYFLELFTSETSGTSQDPYIEITYTKNPTAPTSLLAEGQTNPTNVTDATPEFSAIYNDPDAGDVATKYRLQVSTSSTDWSSLLWDSGTTTMASTTAGERSPDIRYIGSSLTASTTYYWHIAFVDQDGLASAWSTTTSSFTTSVGWTTIYYAGAGDGWTRSFTGSADPWSTRYNEAGGFANYTDAYAYSGVFRDIGYNHYYQIARSIVQFDTSGIPDDATIVSATVHLQGNKYTANSPTFDSNFNLSTTTPASTTALTASDYNIANHGSTLLSTSIPYANWSTSTYNEFPLNATGFAAINKGGYTAFSLRALIDIQNNPPASPGGPDNSYYEIELATSEAAGTSTDPYIEITYVSTNNNPDEPTSLLAEGQTNPTNVTDATPEFSAIYNDPDAGDVATQYRLQVSASSTDWSSLLWDSGTTTMASTTAGERSPDISYAGTALASSTTYYWHIAFVDQDGLASPWSTTTSSFTMSGETTTTVYYAGAGDGWVRGSTGADTWSVRYSGNGGYANHTDNYAPSAVFRGNTTNWYYLIARGIVQFDTSGIPDDATIVSATVHLQGNKYTANSPTFDSNFNLSTTTPSSNTSLTSSDFNIAKHGSTILSTSIPYASWSTSTYNQYPLNATGLAALNKTGYTAFSHRALIDIQNNPPASPGGPIDSYYEIDLATSETSGTSQDPYIEITYTTNVNPTAPTSLLAEGQTNPTNVTDATPEFSAIYNDPDAGDVATQYRLQVSASSTDWTSPMWDSGTTSMASTTAGQRSPDISYAGTALASSTTYYWHIAFVDQDGLASAWSTTTSSFSLATTTTIYAGAGDGWTRGWTGANPWSTQYNGTGAFFDYTDTSAPSAVFRGNVSNYYYLIARAILQFDTSSIPDDATILSATVYLQGNKYTGNSPTFDSNFNLSTAAPAYTNALTYSDFDVIGHGSTPLSTSIPYASWSTSTYNQYPLNATGLAALNKTGYTAFSHRALIDIQNNPPASPGGPDDSYYEIDITTSEASGTSTDPYIEVTYTTGG